MRFVKPLDVELLLDLARRHSCIVTLEENVVAGGAGSAVSECLAEHGVNVAVHHVGIPDRFIEHGSREDCLVLAGLDAANLERAVTRAWVEHARLRAVPGGRQTAV
jgi:1-deoxy-D-xylulose-5-phosphate synthase